MTHREKIQILLMAIEANMELAEGQRDIIRKSLAEGQMKIAQAEEAYEKAVKPYHYFPVELVKEGFAFWNRGGFSEKEMKGEAAVAAGWELRPLKIIRTMKERNGRHTQCLVYQGCLLAGAELLPGGNEFLSLYQIVGFVCRENGCEAKCQRLIMSTPKITESKIVEPDSRPYGRLLEVAACMAGTSDNVSLEYGVW